MVKEEFKQRTLEIENLVLEACYCRSIRARMLVLPGSKGARCRQRPGVEGKSAARLYCLSVCRKHFVSIDECGVRGNKNERLETAKGGRQQTVRRCLVTGWSQGCLLMEEESRGKFLVSVT